MSWRLLGHEVFGHTAAGIADADFHVYRDGTRIATVTDSTNYLGHGRHTRLDVPGRRGGRRPGGASTWPRTSTGRASRCPSTGLQVASARCATGWTATWTAATSFAERWSVSRTHPDLTAMLDGERPDLVVLCSPPNLHAEQAMACLAHASRCSAKAASAEPGAVRRHRPMRVDWTLRHGISASVRQRRGGSAPDRR